MTRNAKHRGWGELFKWGYKVSTMVTDAEKQELASKIKNSRYVLELKRFYIASSENSIVFCAFFFQLHVVATFQLQVE